MIGFYDLTIPYIYPDESLLSADIATISNMRAKANILIVDDDPVIAYLIKELLEKEGFQALVCLIAFDALNELERNSFDLALCDIMMPGMDGFELCRRIRNVSKMPIILISAKNETIDKVSGLTLGADDYITKPFEHYELIARIKSHLRRADWNKEPASSAQILDRKSTRLNSSHRSLSRMPSSA